MQRIIQTVMAVSSVVLTFGLVIFTVFTCTDHETAIFYFIENEEALVGTNFTQDMSIAGMTSTANESFYYLAAATSMWVREVTSMTWRRLPMPPEAETSTALASFRPAFGLERLYAGFNTGLYFTEEAAGQTTFAWQKVTSLGDNQVIQLKAINNNLLVSLLDSATSTSSLFYRNDDTDVWQPVAGLQALPVLINDFTFDGTGYWVTAGSTLYTGQITGTMQPAASQPPSDDTLVGIIYTAGGNYYVSTDNGQVFLSADAANWVPCDESGSNDFVVIINQVNVPFLFFGQAPSRIDSPNIFGDVLVGSFGFGFFTIPDGSTVLTRFQDFTIVPLFTGVVNDFFIDDPEVFVLTLGSGVWKNTYTPGTGFDSNWLQE